MKHVYLKKKKKNSNKRKALIVLDVWITSLFDVAQLFLKSEKRSTPAFYFRYIRALVTLQQWFKLYIGFPLVQGFSRIPTIGLMHIIYE